MSYIDLILKVIFGIMIYYKLYQIEKKVGVHGNDIAEIKEARNADVVRNTELFSNLHKKVGLPFNPKPRYEFGKK